MTERPAEPATPPGWLLWLFLGLLVLPFWPYWVDFEQVRRGLLLVLCGATLVLLPRLPRARGETAFLVFLAFFGVAALISYRSLQPFEALYRVAHFASLLVVLRLGAAFGDRLGAPLATAVLLTSVFGVLQRLGLCGIGWYGIAAEPVSVFGNLNVASEWTAVAAMAVAVLPVRNRALQLAALAFAGCYLVVNGSRSGMIAFAIGLTVLLLRHRQLDQVVRSAAALGGAGIGLLLALAVAQPPPADQDAADAIAQRSSRTLEVRFEIARGCTDLLRERPVFGFGPGQFAVQYPRVRTQREIELSTQERRFAAEVRTAHDDWLELLVEGGLPLALAFACALFALQRGTTRKERLLPLLVLLLIMFARSPLANAPAVVAALLPIATTATAARPLPNWLPWLRRGFGVLLLCLGVLPIVAHQAFAPYVRAIALGRQPDVRCAQTAHAWMWWEPRWLQVLAQEYETAGEPRAAQKAAAMAAELRPHDPQLLALLGRLLSNEGRYEEAAKVARHGLSIDPMHPELRVLLSIALLLEGQHDAAIRVVMNDPHPALRAQLRSHFADLARVAESRGDDQGAARCRMEHAFLSTLDALGGAGVNAWLTAKEQLREFFATSQAAGQLRHDVRPFLLAALQLLALDDVEEAGTYGETAKQRGLWLRDWQREMLGDRIEPLLAIESWFEVLRRRGR